MTTTLVTLSELLDRSGINQKRVLVVRHRPYEPALRKVFAWIVAERPDLFRAYQSAQWRTLEAAMLKADMMVSFVGLEAGQAVFAGAYDIGAHRLIDAAEFWSIPENVELKAFGMTGLDADRETTRWFDMKRNPLMEDTFGRLIIGWPGLERSWWRWAERNTFPVIGLNDQSKFEPEDTPWTELVLSWSDLSRLPRSLQSKLSQWRGVYFIYDSVRGKGYVGSAYGSENILGRWTSYAKTGHGGNKQLRASDPRHLTFSILELTSPTLEAEAVIALESGWKTRLHTRLHGLNEN